MGLVKHEGQRIGRRRTIKRQSRESRDCPRSDLAQLGKTEAKGAAARKGMDEHRLRNPRKLPSEKAGVLQHIERGTAGQGIRTQGQSHPAAQQHGQRGHAISKIFVAPRTKHRRGSAFGEEFRVLLVDPDAVDSEQACLQYAEVIKIPDRRRGGRPKWDRTDPPIQKAAPVASPFAKKVVL